MDPKVNPTQGAESAAFWIRAADFSAVMEKLDRIMSFLTEMHNSLPLRRRKLSQATRRAHARCILQRYDGKCPLCRESRIIAENGSLLACCHQEHFVNRHENGIDKTWLVCKDCNSRKATGKVVHSDVEALFRAYQVILRTHLSERSRGAPHQMNMTSSGRICSFEKKRS